MRSHIGFWVVLAAAVAVLSAGPAFAGTIFFDDGDINPNGGTISYSGILGDPIIGTNIQITQIRPDGALVGTELACSDCFLNFITGPTLTEVVTTDGGGDPIGVSLAFGGPGMFEIVGSINFPGDELDFVNETILTGFFADVLGAPNTLTVGPLTGLFNGAGFDTKHDSLTTFYFGEGDFDFLHTDQLISLQETEFSLEEPGGFSSTVGSAQISNVLVAEPATLLFLGMGLLTSAAVVRRRKS